MDRYQIIGSLIDLKCFTAFRKIIPVIYGFGRIKVYIIGNTIIFICFNDRYIMIILYDY